MIWREGRRPNDQVAWRSALSRILRIALVREALIDAKSSGRSRPTSFARLFRLPHHAGLCRPGCYGSGCFSTTISGAQTSPPTVRSISPRCNRQALIANRYTRGFNIPTARRRRPPRGAHRARCGRPRRRNRTRTRAVETRRSMASGTSRSRTLRVASAHRWARAPQCRRPWVAACWRRAFGRQHAPRCGWCRARTSSCGS